MFDHLINILESVMLSYVFISTADKSRRTVPSAIYGILSFLYITIVNNCDLQEIITSFIDILLAYVLLSVITTYNPFKKLFYAEIPFTILAVTSIFTLSLFSVFYYEKADYALLMSEHKVLVFTVLKIIQITLFYFCIKWMKAMSSFSSSEYFIAAILLLLCRYVAICLQMILINADHPAVYMIIAMLLLALILFLLIKLFLSIHQHISKEKQQETEITQLNERNVSYQKIMQAEDDIRKLRHDMKQFILGLKSSDLSSDNEIMKTINQLEEEMLKVSAPIQTVDETLNYILNVKKDQALRKRIDFSCSIHLSDPFDMEKSDLILLLSNVRDNAILHNGFEKKVKVLIKQQNQNALFSVTNSVDRQIVDHNGNFINESALEGKYGLKTVKEISDRYQIFWTLSQNGYEFCFSTLLPVQNRPHS